MNYKTLDRANEIARMIVENESALCCFEWEKEYGGGSRNPQLIIEFDDGDGGRKQQKIPMVLSDFIVNMIKQAIHTNLSVLRKEFEIL